MRIHSNQITRLKIYQIKFTFLGASIHNYIFSTTTKNEFLYKRNRPFYTYCIPFTQNIHTCIQSVVRADSWWRKQQLSARVIRVWSALKTSLIISGRFPRQFTPPEARYHHPLFEPRSRRDHRDTSNYWARESRSQKCLRRIFTHKRGEEVCELFPPRDFYQPSKYLRIESQAESSAVRNRMTMQ